MEKPIIQSLLVFLTTLPIPPIGVLKERPISVKHVVTPWKGISFDIDSGHKPEIFFVNVEMIEFYYLSISMAKVRFFIFMVENIILIVPPYVLKVIGDEFFLCEKVPILLIFNGPPSICPVYRIKTRGMKVTTVVGFGQDSCHLR